MANTLRRLPWTALAAVGLSVLLAVPVSAEDGKDAKKSPAGGHSYHNQALGITTQVPSGWSVIADKGAAPTSWKRLATFHDKETDAQAVLSARPRRAATLDDLVAMVRADWQKTQEKLPMSAMRKVEASALNPVARVVVDGSYLRKLQPKKTDAGVAGPPQSVTYHVQATYYLGPGYTFLLYASAQQTHWSRLHTHLDRMRDSVRFDQKPDTGPVGEGAYRNDLVGFSCKYPKDYTVVVPQRQNHLVQFESVSKADAVLGVYAFDYTQGASADAERLAAYYEGDKGGTSQVSRSEVSGQEAQLVTAKAMLGGVDSIVLISVLKRGGTIFRLRAEFPASAEAKGRATFDKFVKSFHLGNAPK